MGEAHAPSGEKTESQAVTVGRNKRLQFWAAGLSIGALVAHAVDIPDHLNEWWGFSTFFTVIAAAQFFLGLVFLLRPWRYDESGAPREDADRRGRPYYWLGVALGAASLAGYAVTRTTGLPFLGAEAGREAVTALSLVPAVENVPLVICLVALLRRTRGVRREAT
jgi:hypothetical protein